MYRLATKRRPTGKRVEENANVSFLRRRKNTNALVYSELLTVKSAISRRPMWKQWCIVPEGKV